MCRCIMENEFNSLIKIAKATPEIKRIWIFGSRYKGTHHDGSDLDLAVEVEWVEGRMLGVCENSISLWSAALPKFKGEMQSNCPWLLDIQQYAGALDTPIIHSYIEEASRLIYQKT